MNDNELDERLQRLPRSITPPDPLWPGVARRLRSRSRVPMRAIAVAAILTVFGGGVIAGRLTAPSPAVHDDVTSPFLAAVRVQQAGSAHVRAVSSLAALPSDDPMRAQGREATRAAIAAVERAVAEAR